MNNSLYLKHLHLVVGTTHVISFHWNNGSTVQIEKITFNCFLKFVVQEFPCASVYV